MNWGTKIVFAFIGFAGFIFTLVGICINQDFYLVSKDYYKREIAYEDQISRMNNLKNLKEKPSLHYSDEKRMIRISFPADFKPEMITGMLHLFRPSNANLDKNFELKLNENGIQDIDLNDLIKGLWRVKFNWEYEGKEYYEEKIIVK